MGQGANVRAAIVKYHVRLSLPSPFDSWTPRLRVFWRGLHNKCTHSGPGKQPVDFDQLLDYCQNDRSCANYTVNIRNKVMIITGYFGVRRGAEVVALTVEDVLSADTSGIQLRVRCQKMTVQALGRSARFLPSLQWVRALRPRCSSSGFGYAMTWLHPPTSYLSRRRAETRVTRCRWTAYANTSQPCLAK